MFTLYDLNKELTMMDYRPLPVSLKSFTLDELYAMYENLYQAADNAFFNHDDLLSMALDMDIKKVNLYIRMKEKQQQREGNNNALY